MTDPDKLALMERAGWRMTGPSRAHGGTAFDYSFPGKTSMDTRHYPTEEQARKDAESSFDRAVQRARELLQVVDASAPAGETPARPEDAPMTRTPEEVAQRQRERQAMRLECLKVAGALHAPGDLIEDVCEMATSLCVYVQTGKLPKPGG